MRGNFTQKREVHASSKSKTTDLLTNLTGMADAKPSLMKAKVLILFLALVGLFAAISAGSAFAQTWTQANVPNNWWTGIASSADGTKLVAVSAVGQGNFIYTSTNSGASWISNNVPDVDVSAAWASVASSADGTKLVAVQSYGRVVANSPTSSTTYPGNIYTSTNSGATWMQVPNFPGGWSSVASSADGSKLATVNVYHIYTSTNFGANWMQSSTPNGNWGAIASSADGTKLAATAYQDSIYVSTDSGVTWTNTSSPITNWYGIASSADGNKLAASSYSLICTSTNAGNTWEITTNILTNGRSGQAIASSADGAKLALAAWTRPYTSTDSGVTWHSHTEAPFFNSGYSIASSADGNILALAGLDGWIYVWSNPPPTLPMMSISMTNFLNQQRGYTNYVTLSWPNWATNFVVQQNSNLSAANWTTVTNLPTLITNIKAQTTNYQVFLPLNGSQGFYRLNSP
jgi:hypothetical protein